MNYKKYLKQSKLKEAVIDTSSLTKYMVSAIGQYARQAKLGKWELDIDPNTDGINWYQSNSDIAVWATPFYEEGGGIPIGIQNMDTGEMKDGGTTPFSISGNPKKDVAEYLKVMKKVLSKIK